MLAYLTLYLYPILWEVNFSPSAGATEDGMVTTERKTAVKKTIRKVSSQPLFDSSNCYNNSLITF